MTVGGPGVMDRLVVVDLFSGAGGLSEGFRAAGFHVALAVEKDPYAAETNYFNHSRNKSKFRTRVLTADIADVDFVKERKLLRESLGKPPEVVIGGPPCQGFSRANMRTRTSKNPLNALVLDFVEAVKAMRPLVALLENVADIEKFEDGDTVELLGYAFDDIGYSFNSAVLNAADFGVPQRRRRFIGIATRYGITVTLPKPALSPDAWVTVGKAILDLPALPNGNCKDAFPYRTWNDLTTYQAAMRKGTNGQVTNNLVTRNSELVLERYAYIPQGGNWQDIPDRLMENYADKSRCHQWIYRRLDENEPAVAITHYRKSMLIHPRQNRGLSVREAARLQSFPDTFIFRGPLGSQQQQVANAVPPLLAKAVGRRIRRAIL